MILDAGSKFHDDCRLVAMAVKKRWPISDDMKQKLVERLSEVAFQNPDDEVAIKAAKLEATKPALAKVLRHTGVLQKSGVYASTAQVFSKA